MSRRIGGTCAWRVCSRGVTGRPRAFGGGGSRWVVGGILVGLVALLFADMANVAIDRVPRQYRVDLVAAAFRHPARRSADRRCDPAIHARRTGFRHSAGDCCDGRPRRCASKSHFASGRPCEAGDDGGRVARRRLGRPRRADRPGFRRDHGARAPLFRVPLPPASSLPVVPRASRGAFNTPLAGVAFAIEELANAFEQRVALLVMTAILISGIVSLGLAGDYVYFGTMPATIGLGRTLLIAPVAGVVGGVSGELFARLVLAITFNRKAISARSPTGHIYGLCFAAWESQ